MKLSHICLSNRVSVSNAELKLVRTTQPHSMFSTPLSPDRIFSYARRIEQHPSPRSPSLTLSHQRIKQLQRGIVKTLPAAPFLSAPAPHHRTATPLSSHRIPFPHTNYQPASFFRKVIYTENIKGAKTPIESRPASGVGPI